MTTQELKEYINKVLGNTIRCLLPSYWWKRLFGIVVDKIDEVELNAGKTIETSLKDFEKKYPTIASRTFYFTEDPDSDHAKSNVKLANSLYIQLIGGASSGKQVDISPVYLAMPLYPPFSNFYWIQSPQFFSLLDTTFYNVRLQDGKSYDIVINQSTGVCTQTPASGGGGASALTIYNGETSERNKTIYNKLNQEYNSNSSISSLIQVASGGYTYLADVIIRTYESGYVFKISAKGISEWSGYNRIYPQWTLKSTGQVSVQWMTDFSVKTINSQSILGSGNITIEAGSNVTVDSSLSTSSTNPVQNKVVTNALSEKQNKLVSGEDIKTINGESILGPGDIILDAADEVYIGSTPPTDENVTVWIDLDASVGDVEWDGIVVDEELSPTSTNPIQNKTVYALSERLNGIEAILDNING